jgi:hypothetical protein
VPRGHWPAIRVTEVAPPATSTFGTATLRGTSASLRHRVDRIYGRFQIRALVKMCSDRPGSCEFPICSSKASTMQPGHIHHPKPRGVSTIVRPARFDPSTTASFVSPLAIDAHAIVTVLALPIGIVYALHITAIAARPRSTAQALIPTVQLRVLVIVSVSAADCKDRQHDSENSERCIPKVRGGDPIQAENSPIAGEAQESERSMQAKPRTGRSPQQWLCPTRCICW